MGVRESRPQIPDGDITTFVGPQLKARRLQLGSGRFAGVSFVRFSCDGSRILAGQNYARYATVLDARTLKRLCRVYSPGGCYAGCFSPCGSRAMLGGTGYVCLYDVLTGKLSLEIPFQHRVTSSSWSPEAQGRQISSHQYAYFPCASSGRLAAAGQPRAHGPHRASATRPRTC